MKKLFAQLILFSVIACGKKDPDYAGMYDSTPIPKVDTTLVDSAGVGTVTFRPSDTIRAKKIVVDSLAHETQKLEDKLKAETQKKEEAKKKLEEEKAKKAEAKTPKKEIPKEAEVKKEETPKEEVPQ